MRGSTGPLSLRKQQYTPLMNVVAVADTSLESAKKAYKEAGIAESQLEYCGNADAAQRAVQNGKFVYTDMPEIIARIPLVDMVCESTGVPKPAPDMRWMP